MNFQFRALFFLKIPMWIFLWGSVLPACVYYNVFYNAHHYYKQARRADEGTEKKQNPIAGQNYSRGAPSSVSSNTALYNKAIKKASKILELYGKSPWVDDALLLIGNAYYYQKKYTQAVRKFDELLTNFPQSDLSAEAYYMKGRALLDNRNLEEAENLFLKLIEGKNKFSDEAIMGLAEIAMVRESQSQAKDFYTQIVARSNNKNLVAQANLQVAEMFLKEKQFEQAQKAFAQVSRYNTQPDIDFYAQLMISHCEMEAGDPNKALKTLLKMEKNKKYFPYLSRIKVKTGHVYEKLDQVEEAAKIYLSVGEDTPSTAESAEAYYLLGKLYQNRKSDLEKAKLYYEKAAVQFNGSPYTVLANQRKASLQKLEEYRKKIGGDDKKTIKDSLLTVSKLEQEFMIGELYLTQLDQVDSALNKYNQIIAGESDSSYLGRAYLTKAWIYEEIKKDSVQAKKIYSDIIQKFPKTVFAKAAEMKLYSKSETLTRADSAEILFKEAEKFLFDKSEADEALTQYRAVATRFPDLMWAAKAEYSMAWIYEHILFNNEKAKAYYTQLMERKPQTEYSQKAREKLEKFQKSEFEQERQQEKKTDNSSRQRNFEEEMRD